MTREQLLRPRYKVKIEYPLSNFKVDQVIEPWQISGWHPKDFPDVFREMWWTEERKIEDLPKYLKVYSPGAFIHTALEWRFQKDPSGIDLAYYKCPVLGWRFSAELKPATEEEFLNQ